MSIVLEEEILPSVLRFPGEYISPPVWVSPEATYVVASADNRQAWQRLGAYQDVLSLTIEINTDGIWRILGACTTDASKISDEDNTTTLRCRLPRQRVPHPQVRSILRCVSPCEGAVTLIFEDAPLPPQPHQEHHSVTYDSDNEASATNTTSVTIGSFAIANNTNRCLVLGFGTRTEPPTGNGVVSTISHNGSTAGWVNDRTELRDIDVDSTINSFRNALWHKVAPSAVTATIVITPAGTCRELAANALSVYDVDQTTPLGTTVVSTGEYVTQPATVTVNASAATGDLVYDFLYAFFSAIDTTFVVGSGQTERANATIITYGGSRAAYGASTEAGAATVTMSWTCNGEDNCNYIQHAVPIKVAAVVASYIPKSFMLNQAVMRASVY